MRLDPTLFRAYDIRGIAGKSLTDTSVFDIGLALGSTAREQHINEMAIARDGRLSGPTLSQALAKGIQASGCNVIDIGMVPTPLLYYATAQLPGRSGVMLTGSHNPAEYNGLKMVVNGKTLAEADIQSLYQRIVTNNVLKGTGQYTTRAVAENYLREIITQIRLKKTPHVVIDAGNGVTGEIAPILFRALGCKVTTLFCDIDGTFPHHHPDPSHPDNLQAMTRTVRELQADVGLAFDGDGDRLGVVTNAGTIIWPDRLLMLFARAVLQETPQAKIIYDVKCTHHLEPFIREALGQPLMWKTGHSLIKAKMKEWQAHLAGEMSGHFFFKDRWYGFDDALYAGARLLEILSTEEMDSETLFASIPNSINTPELKAAVAEEEKFDLMQALIKAADFTDAHEIMTIDGLRVNFADGWGLVRPSNTTPYLIMRFEAINEKVLESIQQLFRKWMLSVKPDWVLPF